jgi:GntR family transcriptional regulator/MocR family aminotransferase
VASFPEIAAAAPDPPGVVFGYGMIDALHIVEGLTRLRQCLDAD